MEDLGKLSVIITTYKADFYLSLDHKNKVIYSLQFSYLLTINSNWYNGINFDICKYRKC